MTIDPSECISTFQFTKYVFEELTFKLNKKYHPNKEQNPVDLQFDIKTKIPSNCELSDKGWVILSCFIKNDQSNEPPFELNAIMRGEFKTNVAVSKEKMQKFLELNGVTAMFPFLRSAITDLTRIGNLKPLLLPLINVGALVRKNKKDHTKKEP